MALMWWGKGLWQICMHHWTVHEKVDFQNFPPDTWLRGWGIYSTTFDPVLRNEVKKFSHVGLGEGYIPQLLILSSEMKLKNYPMLVSGGVYSTTFDPELRNERFTLISFMGFPAILSTLQPFQIYIFNRK